MNENLECLLKDFHPPEYYVESFQQWKIKHTPWREDRDRGLWDSDFDFINKGFGTNYDDNERGNGKVYVVLERTDNGKGKLYSYGNAHKDASGRWNMHRLEVVDDYRILCRILEAVPAKPRESLQKLVQAISKKAQDDQSRERKISWDVDDNSTLIIGNPIDLFSNMDTLYILDKTRETQYGYIVHLR